MVLSSFLERALRSNLKSPPAGDSSDASPWSLEVKSPSHSLTADRYHEVGKAPLIGFRSIVDLRQQAEILIQTG
jgi:hypothetical protein